MAPAPMKDGEEEDVVSDEEDDTHEYEDHDNGDDDEDQDDDEGRSGPSDDALAPAASWMSGKWGVAWRVRPGDNRFNKQFNVKKLVAQVKKITGASYVLFGISGGAKGDKYIAPHSVLSAINPGSCPPRDLFGEMAAAFQEEGYKVLVYMATEGPAQLHHGNTGGERGAQWIQNWSEHVKEVYGMVDHDTLKKAYAEIIVKEYAERYGSKIDGWWFDHAGDKAGNAPLLRSICRAANPHAVLAFNKGRKIPLRNNNPPYEDYTSGHPTPMRNGPPNLPANLKMVEAIEASDGGYLWANGSPSLGHMFMPTCERWNSGRDVLWEEDEAVEWMSRVLDAGGAWTWNVPLSDRTSQLQGNTVEFMARVGERLKGREGGGTGGGDEL